MRKILQYSIIAVLVCFGLFTQTVDAYSYGWGYKKNTDQKIPDIGKYKEMLDKYGAYYADFDANNKEIYLTFDNGYEEGYTGGILDVLKKHKVPATFFVTGHYVEEEPDLVKRMANEGHIIGNHSYHHPDFTIINKAAVQEELESLEEAVAEITDQKEMQYLRPPRGLFNEETLTWSNDLGYTHVFWSLAFSDWKTDAQKGWRYAYDEIMEQIHPGAIILLHTVSKDNAEALDQVIKDLKTDGYIFKSLDDLVIKNIIPEEIFGL